MEKDFLITIKNSQDVIENSKNFRIIENGKIFAGLLKKGELTWDMIENKAREINSDAISLILTVFGFCDLDEEYLMYKKEKEGILNEEEIPFSFLEKIQKEFKVVDEDNGIKKAIDEMTESFKEGSFSLDKLKKEAKNLNIEALDLLHGLVEYLCETDNQLPLKLAEIFDKELDNGVRNKLVEMIKGIFSMETSGNLVEIIKNNINLTEDKDSREIVSGMLMGCYRYMGVNDDEKGITSLILKVERKNIREKGAEIEAEMLDKLKEIKDGNDLQNKAILEEELDELKIKRDNIDNKLSDIAYQLHSILFEKKNRREVGYSSKEVGDMLEKQRLVERELTQLLSKNNLAKEKIAGASAELGISVMELSIRVLGRARMDDLFEEEMRQKIKVRYEEKIAAEKNQSEIIDEQILKQGQKEEEKRNEKNELLRRLEIANQDRKTKQSINETMPESQQVSEQIMATSEIITPAESQKEIIKPEKKNWWEVKRETEVMAVEDLDGKMIEFYKLVKKLNIAQKEKSGPYWKWKGENKKLVFVGDILGDRGLDGTEIVFVIGDLAYQAEQEGGGVDFLCGNHDHSFLQFLCGAFGDKLKIDEKMASSLSAQYKGIWELAQFDPDPNSELKKVDMLIKDGDYKGRVSREFARRQVELWAELYNKIPKILANMKKDPIGKNILEDICRMKVMVVHDDTLYCHTDPTAAMVADLTKDGNIHKRVSEINRIFQDNLRGVLFQDEKLNDEFRQIGEVYLNTGNRQYFVEGADLTEDEKRLNVEKIRNSGINAVVHGHSGGNDRTFEKNGLMILTLSGTFKGIPFEDGGVSTIRKNGRIDLGGKSFRVKSSEISE